MYRYIKFHPFILFSIVISILGTTINAHSAKDYDAIYWFQKGLGFYDAKHYDKAVEAFSKTLEFIVGLFAPTTKPGTYDVFISVGSRDGTPTIALPLKDGDGQRRYRIGSIILEFRNHAQITSPKSSPNY